MSGDNIKEIIKDYARVLKRNNFLYSKIYLFGSYAKKKAGKNSDIDVAVVISSGATSWFKKMKLWRLARQVDTRIEPILLNSSEFIKGNISQMAYEVKRTGKRIM